MVFSRGGSGKLVRELQFRKAESLMDSSFDSELQVKLSRALQLWKAKEEMVMTLFGR